MAVVGAAAVLIAGSPLFSRIGSFFDRAFWPGRPDAIVRNFQSWAYSVTFAVMAGWGTLMAIVIANAFASREAWVWWSIAASLAVWYPLDTGRSLLHKVYANAALNTALLVILAIPLIGTFGEFN
jgi:hypothetical protein